MNVHQPCPRCGAPTRCIAKAVKRECEAKLVARCRTIIEGAQADLGTDLGGGSMLDLVADNIPHVSLPDLRAALVRAGFTQYERR